MPKSAADDHFSPDLAHPAPEAGLPCGVPVERAEDYLNRLISQGHRVAVCEQVEDPAEARQRGAKSVVRREVVW